MKAFVHRCRFGDIAPLGIACLDADPHSYRLAVVKDKGEIEIRLPFEAWRSEIEICGNEELSIKTIKWSASYDERGRLFGASLSGIVFEIDLSTLALTNIQNSNGGPVWSMSMSPNTSESLFACGCDDGTIRLYDYSDQALNQTRVFPSMNGRVLCMDWYRNDNMNAIFVGLDSGYIRSVCPSSSSSSSFRSFIMSISPSEPRLPEHIRLAKQADDEKLSFDSTAAVSDDNYCRCILMLNDRLLVTGDCKGYVRLWDTKTCTIICSFRSHAADVLSLSSSSDGCRIFASGVDSKIACIARLYNGRWGYIGSQRPHLADVVSLVSIRNRHDANDDEILISGSVDGKLAVMSIRQFTTIRPKKIIPNHYMSRVSVSVDRRIVAVAHQTSISLWKFKSEVEGNKATDVNHKQLLKLDLVNLVGHVRCSVISGNGNHYAYCDEERVRICHLHYSDDGSSVRASLLRVVDEDDCTVVIPSLSAMCFSSDGSKLFCISSGSSDDDGDGEQVGFDVLHVLTINGQMVECCQRLCLNRFNSSNELIPAVVQIIVSNDCMWLATRTASGQISVVDLDRFVVCWQFGSSSSLHYTPHDQPRVTCIAFQPASVSSLGHVLAMIHSDGTLSLATVETKQRLELSSSTYFKLKRSNEQELKSDSENDASIDIGVAGFARVAPSSQVSCLAAITDKSVQIPPAQYSCSFDACNPNSLIVSSHSFVTIVDLSQVIAKPTTTTLLADKNKRGIVCVGFKGVLHASFLSSSGSSNASDDEFREILIVESPYSSILYTISKPTDQQPSASSSRKRKRGNHDNRVRVGSGKSYPTIPPILDRKKFGT